MGGEYQYCRLSRLDSTCPSMVSLPDLLTAASSLPQLAKDRCWLAAMATAFQMNSSSPCHHSGQKSSRRVFLASNVFAALQVSVTSDMSCRKKAEAKATKGVGFNVKWASAIFKMILCQTSDLALDYITLCVLAVRVSFPASFQTFQPLRFASNSQASKPRETLKEVGQLLAEFQASKPISFEVQITLGAKAP